MVAGCLRAVVRGVGVALMIADATGAEYEIGGPLAGVRLPLYTTHHGEPPGQPGCIPELAAAAKAKDPHSTAFTPQGQRPEVELYPEAVEHWRTYWQHYMPIRSFYDVQSQRRRWTAPEIPGTVEGQIEHYAEPVYWVPAWDEPVFTGRTNPPLPVVRCEVGSPLLDLDLGILEAGLYVVRWVGAVETKALRPFLLPAYVAMEVNDGLRGEVSRYRIRIGYVDEFYSLAELFFYAPEKREYRAKTWLDEGSQVEVLLHDILLDDVLAGTDPSPVKRRGLNVLSTSAVEKGFAWVREQWSSLPVAEQQARRSLLASTTKEARFARDAAIWYGLPHPNCQIGFSKLGNDYPNWNCGGRASFSQGLNGKSQAEIETEYGAWEYAGLAELTAPKGVPLSDEDVSMLQGLLVNRKLNLAYTVEDLRLGRSLPDPYPYKDSGAGLYTPDPTDPTKGQIFAPIGNAVNSGQSYYGYANAYLGMMRSGTPTWLLNGDQKAARDAAMALIRFAYLFPTFDASRSLHAVAMHAGWGNHYTCRHRPTSNYAYDGPIDYHNPPLYAYDALLDYIRGNEDLAESVARFVPWVTSAEDVVRLIDVYLVQTTLKRVLRYQYYGSGREPERVAELAALVGNAKATAPWLEWLFSRVFFYPGAPGGIQDIIIRGTDRDGRSPIGSFSYTMGEFSADKIAEKLERYLDLGGDPKYDLRDPRRCPKVIAALEFDVRVRTAGVGIPRLGSSSGPDHGNASGFFPERAATGWRWTHDPQFAYVLCHYVGRRDETDPDWQTIEAAAARVRRAPWLENRSRVLPNLMALLETGLEHDDFRFRRSVGVRVGLGQGHHHEDTMDLQMHAHGLPVVLDSGQRRDTAYSTPKDTHSRVHNTVVVDGADWMGYSWARTLSDAENARYLCVQAVPLHGTRLFRRQVALIDVDEGSYGPDGPLALTPAQYSPALTAAMPTGVTTPNSYVFDVFRVSGGAQHTYCFHGLVTDPTGPQPMTNLERHPVPPDLSDATAQQVAAWLDEFRHEKYYGAAPAVLQFTFAFPRDRPTQTHQFAAVGTEKALLNGAFDATAPPRFTRWFLLGAEGALVMKGDQYCQRYEHCLPNVFVQPVGAADQEAESAFVALIEPYAGAPFVAGVRTLAVAANEADARRAVAVEVEIAANARVGREPRTDVCFADGRPERVRQLVIPEGACCVSAEFAYLSTDAHGVRQATISGGILLDAPGIRIEAATGELSARVVAVDYPNKTLRVDRAWPAWNASARLVEVGTLPESGTPGYVTSEMATSARRDHGGTVLTLLRGADYYRAPVTAIESENGIVVCSGDLPFSAVERTGLEHGFLASNDGMTRFWRADVLAGDRAVSSFPFRLYGLDPWGKDRVQARPVADDFAPEMVLRLWEYGVGDTARMNSFVNVRRLPSGEYEVAATTDAKITLAGISREFRADDLAKTDGCLRFRTAP